jgi:uncharacterized membrane protein
VPWLSVMMLGYALGSLYQPGMATSDRKRKLLTLGIASISLFVVLRIINLYGDPSPWTRQPDVGRTILSFINVTKYPVSLEFVLMTAGALLILLSCLEKAGNWLRPFHTIGRVPLFYFVVHFFVTHAAALLLMMWREGRSIASIDFHFSKSFGGIPPGTGVSLAGVYVAWIVIVLVMYFLCARYEQYKSSHGYRWLSYL